MTVRADSGFWSWRLVDHLDAHRIAWSITVRLHETMKQAIAGIDETAWVDIDYTLGGQAQVAETVYTTGPGNKTRSVRLVVRRTRLIALAAVIVNRSGRPLMRLPARWPWARQVNNTLTAIRALPGRSG